ncbi:MAG: hypothetical protein LC792_00165, partial [Actinobacteria bacterium]|nr:hypothetical protein [Actinomycetota bacterium]
MFGLGTRLASPEVEATAAERELASGAAGMSGRTGTPGTGGVSTEHQAYERFLVPAMFEAWAE